uniref:Uncharacterized protein n=1 Tax=Clastoptera arizonana TaxID=38151 RepID=A0A1B6DKQ3_9HEMI
MIGLGIGYKPMPNEGINMTRAEHLFQDEIEDLVKRPQPSDTPKVKVGIGVSGMPYKPNVESYSAPRPDTLFQEDLEDFVKSPQPALTPKEPLSLQVDQRD